MNSDNNELSDVVEEKSNTAQKHGKLVFAESVKGFSALQGRLCY